MSVRRLLVVGDPRPTQMGGHFLTAARQLGLDVRICDVAEAYAGPRWGRQLAWRLAGHRPWRLRAFGRDVLAVARAFQPDLLLATGLAPVDHATLGVLGRLGVPRVNVLTDDPWNPVHRAPWFLRALVGYDHVFTPRRANVPDLEAAGIGQVDYLAFGYSPNVHHPEPPADRAAAARFDVDVLLAGGADPERAALLGPLLGAGPSVALYGGYWERFAATRPLARGFLSARELRQATGAARVSLGLVRRANRDGHAMRTFEVPAMGGCLLADRTGDHEALFGPEGRAVLYFTTGEELVEKARWLLARPDVRQRLAGAARTIVTGGGHTYRDRLAALLGRVAA